MEKAKPFAIPKRAVWNAYKKVRANKGAAGIDEMSIEEFDRKLKGNLYKLWNRLSSGSYFPPPVKAVPIPKKGGGERILGVPKLEPCFLDDSYGYRPGKSAHDALAI